MFGLVSLRPDQLEGALMFGLVSLRPDQLEALMFGLVSLRPDQLEALMFGLTTLYGQLTTWIHSPSVHTYHPQGQPCLCFDPSAETIQFFTRETCYLVWPQGAHTSPATRQAFVLCV